MSFLWNNKRSLIFSSLTAGVITTFKFLSLILLPLIVVLFGNSNDNYILIIAVILITLSYLVWDHFEKVLELKQRIIIGEINYSLTNDFAYKISKLHYEKLNSNFFLKQLHEVTFPIRNQGVILKIAKNMSVLIRNVILIAVLIGLFAFTNIYVFVFLIIFGILSFVFYGYSQKYEKRSLNKIIAKNREFEYYVKISQDNRFAKDIRLFKIQPMLMRKMKRYLENTLELFRKLLFGKVKYNYISVVFTILQVFIPVIFLVVYNQYLNMMGINDTVLIAMSISIFSGVIRDFLNSYVSLSVDSLYLVKYFKVIDEVKSYEYNDKGIDVSTIENVVFENVSFKYPNTDNYVLKNLNLSLVSKKTYALVGLNGVGKSTIIKLLCGFYKLTEGRILINGIDMQNITIRSLYKNIGVTNQDFRLFSIPVFDNISLGEVLDNSALKQTLREVDLNKEFTLNKINNYSVLYKDFDREGYVPSGGNEQKIAIARSLYKKPSLLVLDEPTFALSAINELEIFNLLLKNNEMHKPIKLLISHRLSVCKEVDEILVLHNGKIVESGSFDRLITLKGDFYIMWNQLKENLVNRQ
jgi:ABC-type multidrug transport system fused ATPase/permease subunit